MSNRKPIMMGINALAMLALCIVLIAGALWRWRETGWGSMAWLAGFVVMTAIRIPHVARNRANMIVTARKGMDEKLLLIGMFVTMMVLPLLYLATGVFAFADYTLPDWATTIGAVGLVPMLWLFQRSHADLGRNWSPGLEVRENHGLIQRGVYARWRHPMYIAIWIAAFTQPLLLHNWIVGLLVLPAVAAMWFLRVPQEEAMLRERFGTAYDGYCVQVGRVWPRLSALQHPIVEQAERQS